MFGAEAMNPHGTLIAVCGTMLSLPVLAFARRYLHGEFMFGRFSGLCAALVLGFNLVATAPSLEQTLAGWSLFGFASAFLIGAYNERPTVRNNATFAFAVYKFSDLALLTAATFAHMHSGTPNEITAGCLLLAALFKASQFPLVSLFARSMEGPTPASALGYAGLSAHVGIVLLTSTMPLWFGFEWARVLLGAVGVATAIYATLLLKIRADRKGAIALATSATLGLIFTLLALGYPNLALVLCLGHASFRMNQILRAPNVIADMQKLRTALGYLPWPKVVPDWLYRFVWGLHRCLVTDLNFLHILHLMSRPMRSPMKLTRVGQWVATSVIVVLAGLPFTPVSHYFEELVSNLLQSHPWTAVGLMFGHFVVSVLLIRFLFMKVLRVNRFSGTKPPQP